MSFPTEARKECMIFHTEHHPGEIREHPSYSLNRAKSGAPYLFLDSGEGIDLISSHPETQNFRLKL
jgi:hypothetical protein